MSDPSGTDLPSAATVVPPVEPENGKEGIDLRPDGGVHLWLDGTKYRLRRPRGREFRKLREELQDHLDAMNEMSDDVLSWAEKLQQLGVERKKRGEPEVTTEERAEERRRGRELRDLTEGLLAKWWASTVTTLAVAEGTTIDAEDLPPWLSDTTQALRLLDHWRSVPSLSGVL